MEPSKLQPTLILKIFLARRLRDSGFDSRERHNQEKAKRELRKPSHCPEPYNSYLGSNPEDLHKKPPRKNPSF